MNSIHFVSYDDFYKTSNIADTVEPNEAGSSSQGGEVLSPHSLEVVPDSSGLSEGTSLNESDSSCSSLVGVRRSDRVSKFPQNYVIM